MNFKKVEENFDKCMSCDSKTKMSNSENYCNEHNDWCIELAVQNNCHKFRSEDN